MWKTDRPSAGTQEFPVQGCKQPRLDLVAIAQLVAFGRPDIECLLREITRVVLRASQAEGESVKRFIVLGHDQFKFIGRHNTVPRCEERDSNSFHFFVESIVLQNAIQVSRVPRGNPFGREIDGDLFTEKRIHKWPAEFTSSTPDVAAARKRLRPRPGTALFKTANRIFGLLSSV